MYTCICNYNPTSTRPIILVWLETIFKKISISIALNMPTTTLKSTVECASMRRGSFLVTISSTWLLEQIGRKLKHFHICIFTTSYRWMYTMMPNLVPWKNSIVYCDSRHLFHKHWMLDQKKQIVPIDIWNVFPKVAKIDKNKNQKKKHLSMRQCSLFCFVKLRSPMHWQYFMLCSWYLLKPSISRGAPTWFVTIWNYGVEVIDYWITFLMKIK